MAATQHDLLDAALGSRSLEEWLALWEATQGGATGMRRFQAMVDCLPFDDEEAIRGAVLGCGPGALGRMMLRRFRNAEVEFVDGDEFLLELCGAANAAAGLHSELRLRDLRQPEWKDGLAGDVHAVLAGNALRRLDYGRLGEVIADVFDLLRPGGVFVFHEPVKHVATRAPEQQADEAEKRWEEFRIAVSAATGRDENIQQPSADRDSIGDTGLSVTEYCALLRQSGFKKVDIVGKEGSCLTLAAQR